jgi:hypothetical protein
MNDYNQQEHSKLRLGAVGHIPSVPLMPVAAQISVASGMLHLKFDGGVYVRTGLPSLTPSTFQTVVAAIKSQPTELSYSGSPSPYFILSVTPDPGGQFATLKAGDTTIGKIAVFPEAEIIGLDALDPDGH